MFEQERMRILDNLGDLALEIQHVGSTAIPGMKAKPEIDLLIIIKDISDIDAVSTAMVNLGYDVRGECGIEGRYYYSKNTERIRTHKVHVCELSHENVRRQIAFRDYMRDHPREAREYQSLKSELAETNTTGMEEYLEGKREYIEGIIRTAFNKGYGKQYS